MKYLASAAVLFTCYIGASAFDCTGLPDGVYGWGCRSYTICKEGQGTQVNCEYPDVYNPDKQECDDITNVGYPCGLLRDCTDREDGRYAEMLTMCTSYYTCDDGLYLGHNPCPTGLVFSEDANVCDWPFNVAPPCGTKEDNLKIQKERQKTSPKKIIKSPKFQRLSKMLLRL